MYLERKLQAWQGLAGDKAERVVWVTEVPCPGTVFPGSDFSFLPVRNQYRFSTLILKKAPKDSLSPQRLSKWLLRWGKANLPAG